MNRTTARKLATTIALALLALSALTVLMGCEVCKTIDKAIWSPDPTGITVGTPGTPATPGTQPGTSPPIAEIIAAVLGLFGFGGMAKWLHSSVKNGQVTTDDLEVRVAALEAARTKTSNK